MATRGYFPPSAGRPKQASPAPSQPTQKKADAYTMNQERKNPDVTEYDRSEKALEHEMPDMRTEWKKDERTPVGLPAPSAEASKKDAGEIPSRPRLSEKEAARLKAHAGRCLRLAKALTPRIAMQNLSVASREDLLLRQAEDLMGLPVMAVQRVLERVEHLKRYADSLSSKMKTAQPDMPPPMKELPTPEAPEGESLLDEAEQAVGEKPEGENGDVPPECQVYVDKAVEEALEGEGGELAEPGAEGDELAMPDLEDLDDAFGGGEMAASQKTVALADMTEDEKAPTDEELLDNLEEKLSSKPAAPAPQKAAAPQKAPAPQKKAAPKPVDRFALLSKKVQAGAASAEEYALFQKLLKGAGSKQARDPAHWEKSLMDVEKPAEDYHNEGASAYTEPETNSADFNKQMEMSNPVAAAKAPVGPRKADGGETHSDPESSDIDPWQEREHPASQEGQAPASEPMGVKFEEQMEMSNPVASEEAPDPLIASLFEESLRRDKIPLDASGDLDATVRAFATTKDPNRPPTINMEAQPAGVQASSPKVAKAASRKVVPMRPAPQAGAPRPSKAGVETVAGLGRKVASTQQNEAKVLSSLWRTSPDVSEVFNK